MTKQQKNWLYVFLAMFIVPELLWSPTLGILPFGKEFLGNADNHQIITVILFMQLIGLIFSAVSTWRFVSKTPAIWLSIIALIVLALWTFFIFYISFATLNASFP